MIEKWEDIVGYIGYYQVSNLGRVRSLDREAYRLGKSKTGFQVKLKGKIMRQKLNHGYFHVNLSVEGMSETFKVHRLVAEAFIPNPQGKPNVNHIDTNKTNNTQNNLEWCTQLENIVHSRNLGNYDFLNNDNPLAKLTKEEVLNICTILDTSSLTYAEIADSFKVKPNTIKYIDIGHTWSHITGRKKV